MATFTESVIEEAALAWLAGLDYSVQFGPTIAPGEAAAEREDYSQVALARWLRGALAWLNPPDKQEQATQTVLEQAEVLCAEWVLA